MPYSRAKKPCNHPGCKNIIPAKEKYCDEHKVQHKNDYARKKPTASIQASYKWKKFRRWYLRRHPVCAIANCNQPATIVDHIVPINEGGAVWDESNLQALCKKHHDQKTARENGGFGNAPRG